MASLIYFVFYFVPPLYFITGYISNLALFIQNSAKAMQRRYGHKNRSECTEYHRTISIFPRCFHREKNKNDPRE